MIVNVVLAVLENSSYDVCDNTAVIIVTFFNLEWTGLLGDDVIIYRLGIYCKA